MIRNVSVDVYRATATGGADRSAPVVSPGAAGSIPGLAAWRRLCRDIGVRWGQFVQRASALVLPPPSQNGRCALQAGAMLAMSPEAKFNYIFLPIAAVVVGGLFIVSIVLHRREQRQRDRAERRAHESPDPLQPSAPTDSAGALQPPMSRSPVVSRAAVRAVNTTSTALEPPELREDRQNRMMTLSSVRGAPVVILPLVVKDYADLVFLHDPEQSAGVLAEVQRADGKMEIRIGLGEGDAGLVGEDERLTARHAAHIQILKNGGMVQAGGKVYYCRLSREDLKKSHASRSAARSAATEE